jgi:hypothetical protein
MRCLVMSYGMMLCHVVAVVFLAWGSVVLSLSSTFSVAKPMVFHVHCFQFLDEVVVDNAKCSGVVRLHWGWRLGMVHEFEGMAGGYGFSAINVESPHLSLCCHVHDCLDNLCNCEDGTIFWWFGGAVGHEEMSACPAGCL